MFNKRTQSASKTKPTTNWQLLKGKKEKETNRQIVGKTASLICVVIRDSR